MRRRKRNKWSKELLKRLIDLDLTTRDIAKAVGRTPEMVRYVLRMDKRSPKIEKYLEKRLKLGEGWFEKAWKEKGNEMAKSGN